MLPLLSGLDGHVLFLGTSHATNTSLHLAEYRADIDIAAKTCASEVLVDGNREWVRWEDVDFDDEDFPAYGEAFESEHPDAFETGTVGVGDAKRISQPPLMDFAVEWFATIDEDLTSSHSPGGTSRCSVRPCF